MMASSRTTGSSDDLFSRWLPKRTKARSSSSPPASMRKMLSGASLPSKVWVSGESVCGSGYGMRAIAGIVAAR